MTEKCRSVSVECQAVTERCQAVSVKCQAVTEKCWAVVYEIRSFAGQGVDGWKCSGSL